MSEDQNPIKSQFLRPKWSLLLAMVVLIKLVWTSRASIWQTLKLRWVYLCVISWSERSDLGSDHPDRLVANRSIWQRWSSSSDNHTSQSAPASLWTNKQAITRSDHKQMDNGCEMTRAGLRSDASHAFHIPSWENQASCPHLQKHVNAQISFVGINKGWCEKGYRHTMGI